MPGLASVSNALPECRLARAVHYRASVDSTNRLARQLGEAGEPDGTLVVADEQTAGRGRHQRTWVSPPGAGLYASVVLRPPFAAAESGPAIQLAAGIAIAEALGGFLPEQPSLRWPNDCYVRDRKIAGVLVEAETSGHGFDFLVCGMGINVNHQAEDFPADLRDRATSLALQVGHRVSRLSVLQALLVALDSWESAWRSFGMGPIRDRWLELSPGSVGGRVNVQTDRGMIEGEADGLSDEGYLRVRSDGAVQEIAVGELVRVDPS